MTDIGIVVIGRNEGERLRRCLTSVLGRGMTVVYVDSASTDCSAGLARSMGAEVVDLDMSRPFAASRARNEGFERLRQTTPDVHYVQFVDGDCEMNTTWFDIARTTLDAREESAVVCGRVRERFPEHSIYNRLADIEWNTPIGEVKTCGGIAMMRVLAFVQVKGFDATVPAGEEPELCQRLRSAGWKILRLDAEMTLHDSAILRFGQWWKRSIRFGYATMDISHRFGQQGLYVNQVRSVRTWVYGWPIATMLVAGIICLVAGPKWALVAMTIVVAALPLQMMRTARGIRPRAASWRDAAAYGVFIILGKWANEVGQRRWLSDRAANKHARLIEYK